MINLQNICVKYIAKIITANRKDPRLLFRYISDSLCNTIIVEVNKRLAIQKRNKNKRHRRANKRLAVRYMIRRRNRFGNRDIDFL